VPNGGPGRISDRNELASAAVWGGAKHVPYAQNGWSNFAMVGLLAGPYVGLEWKNVLDTQCQSGAGFDEFPSAMNWLVLQLGGRSTYTQNEWPNFAMRDGWPAWPLLALALGSCDCECCDGSFHRPLAGAKQDPNPDFRLRHGWRLHCYGY
jgi:hypothetical protein